MGCVEGYRFVVTVVQVNETYRRPSGIRYIYEKCPVDLGPIFSIIFLILIFIAAFVLSTLIIVTISTSYTLKKPHVNHFFMSLCVIVIVDCLFNLLMSICYVAIRQWKFGYFACYFNSFTMNTLSLQMSFGLLFLVVDRTLVAKKVGSYMSLSKTKVRLIILFSWVLSLIFSVIPHSLGVDSSLPYRKRYSCSIANPLDQYLLIPQIAIFIVLIIAVLVVCIIVTLCIFHKEQKKHKKARGNQTFRYFDQILMTPYYKNEAYATACVSILTVGYLILWYPFNCVTTLTPLMTSHWDNQTTKAVIPEAEPRIEIQAGLSTRMEIDKNLTNSNASSPDYFIPEMRDTPDYETAFVWMRYIYDLFIPLVILIILKDVRAKCKALIFVCRPNTVDSSSPKHISPPYLNASIRGLMTKDKKPKNDNMVNFKTPVLFATSEGLHIRTIEDTYQEMQESRPLISFTKSSTIEPLFHYDLCDVTLGNEDVTDFEDPDDDQDFAKNPLNVEKSYANPVVEKAHRVAAGQKVSDNTCTGFFLSSEISRDKLPPTPPKPKSTETQDEEEESEHEMVPIDLEQAPKKNNKMVRFNTDLNKEILHTVPSEVESALELSIGSKMSNGSGHLADEEVSPSPRNVGSKEDRRLAASKSKKRPAYPAAKKGNPKSLPSKNGRHPNAKGPPKRPSPPRPTKPKTTKKHDPHLRGNNLREMNIKSRYISQSENKE